MTRARLASAHTCPNCGAAIIPVAVFDEAGFRVLSFACGWASVEYSAQALAEPAPRDSAAARAA